MTLDDIFLKDDIEEEGHLFSVEILLQHHPLFPEEYCHKLDTEAQDLKNPQDRLSPIELKFLAARLMLYYWEYDPFFGSDEFPTPKMKLKNLNRIKKLTENLLYEFGLSEISLLIIDSFHYEEGGIFYKSKYQSIHLLRALQLIYYEADRALLSSADVRPQRGKSPQPRKDILLRRLGYEFGRTWGGGKLSASRTSASGGPSVRFVRNVLQTITKEIFEPATIHDQLRPLINDINTALSINDPYYECVFEECEALREGGTTSK